MFTLQKTLLNILVIRRRISNETNKVHKYLKMTIQIQFTGTQEKVLNP